LTRQSYYAVANTSYLTYIAPRHLTRGVT